MTLFKSTDGLVCGQPMSPFFGAQNGIQGAGAVVIPSPAASANSGVQQPVHAAVSTGSMPQNAMINTANGVSPGGNPAVFGSDPASIAQQISNGNGSDTERGAPVPGSSGNPSNPGTVNNQIFSDGVASAVAASATGPTTDNTSSATECPLQSSMLTNNIVLFQTNFLG
jgi:hypothetical protein